MSGNKSITSKTSRSAVIEWAFMNYAEVFLGKEQAYEERGWHEW